jgi:transcriptional regulator of arginine metabolism
MEKQRRHLAVKQILASRNITTQSALAAAMRKEGFKTTQATLSRDMKELGIAWMHTPNGAKYVLSPEYEEGRLTTLIGYEVEQIESNETIVIIKTLPGRAQGVAEIIDHLRLPLVLGTLAGDNTVFVLPRSIKKIKETIAALQGVLKKTKTMVA